MASLRHGRRLVTDAVDETNPLTRERILELRKFENWPKAHLIDQADLHALCDLAILGLEVRAAKPQAEGPSEDEIIAMAREYCDGAEDHIYFVPFCNGARWLRSRMSKGAGEGG